MSFYSLPYDTFPIGGWNLLSIAVMVNITALGAMILLSCKGMFDGEVPDSTIITAFQKDSNETNGTEIVKETVIGSTSTTVSVFTGDFKEFRIQYTKEDGKDEFGGHIVNERELFCPVNGEDNQLNNFGKDLCNISPFYRLGDGVVMINKNPKQPSFVYSLDGGVIDSKGFVANVDCTQKPCGFDAGEKVVVDHQGNCFAFGNTGDWLRQRCSATKIKVKPGETSHPFHLRYLSIVYKCQVKPALKESELDNTYISFVRNPRANDTLINEKEEQSESSTLLWVVTGGCVFAFCFIVVVIAVVVYCILKKVIGKRTLAFYEKKFIDDLRDNANKTLEEPPNERIVVDYELDDLSIEEIDKKTAAYDQDLHVMIPRNLHKTDNILPIEKPQDVTEREEFAYKKRIDRPKTIFEGPRNNPPESLAKPAGRALAGKSEKAVKNEGKKKKKPVKQAMVKEVKKNVNNMAKVEEENDNNNNEENDEDNMEGKAENKEQDRQEAGPGPTLADLAKKERKKRRKELIGTPGNPVVYKMVERFRKGSFGVIYQYKSDGGDDYAVKFFRTDDAQSLRRAKNIYRAFKRIMSEEELSHIMSYVDIGRTRDTTYLIMPWYGENMEKMKTDGMTLQQKFILIYQYLAPIRQMRSLSMAHLSIKPKNYLRKLGSNQLILTELGNARRFKTKRRHVIGSPTYMAATTHECRPVGFLDDPQSWFIMCAEILEPPLPWKGVLIAGDKDYKQVLAIKKRYLEMLGGNGDSGKFLVELREEFWNNDYQVRPSISRILDILEGFEKLYNFKFNDPWE